MIVGGNGQSPECAGAASNKRLQQTIRSSRVGGPASRAIFIKSRLAAEAQRSTDNRGISSMKSMCAARVAPALLLLCSLGCGPTGRDAREPPADGGIHYDSAVSEVTNAPEKATQEPQTASLVQLIAAPDLFDGRRVRTVGFCVRDYGGCALYLHEEDYLAAMTLNSVHLDVDHVRRGSTSPVHRAYCIVEAVFRPSKPDGARIRSGSLEGVTRLDRMPSMEELRDGPGKGR